LMEVCIKTLIIDKVYINMECNHCKIGINNIKKKNKHMYIFLSVNISNARPTNFIIWHFIDVCLYRHYHLYDKKPYRAQFVGLHLTVIYREQSSCLF
jgi:hypothetical protein